MLVVVVGGHNFFRSLNAVERKFRQRAIGCFLVTAIVTQRLGGDKSDGNPTSKRRQNPRKLIGFRSPVLRAQSISVFFSLYFSVASSTQLPEINSRSEVEKKIQPGQCQWWCLRAAAACCLSQRLVYNPHQSFSRAIIRAYKPVGAQRAIGEATEGASEKTTVRKERRLIRCA